MATRPNTALCLVMCVIPSGIAAAQSTTLISHTPTGGPALGHCKWVSISRDLRFIAFATNAFNLAGTSHPEEQVYVLDRETDELELVSVNDGGQMGNWWSISTALSDDGRYVAFHCAATNMMPGVNDPQPPSPPLIGAFVRDRQKRTTRCMQVDYEGVPVGQTDVFWGRVSMSGTGRFVAFDTTVLLVEGDTPTRDIYVRDRDFDNDGVFDEPEGGKTIRISVNSQGAASNGDCQYPQITADGRFVVFTSVGSNLVPDDTDTSRDSYLHDRDADGDGIFDEPGQILTERMSVRTDGSQASPGNAWWSSVSGDGRFVAFHSLSPDLVPGDANGFPDVFVRDRLLNQTERVSLSYNGGEANGASTVPEISEDGRFVAYRSAASNSFSGDLTGAQEDIVIYDRWNRTTKLGSYSSAHTQILGIGTPFLGYNGAAPAISADGRLVAFGSVRDTVVYNPGGDPMTNVLLRDRGPHYLADVDGAGFVDVNDLLAVITMWGPCPPAPAPCAADLNGDGEVDVNDLLAIIANWG